MFPAHGINVIYHVFMKRGVQKDLSLFVDLRVLCDMGGKSSLGAKAGAQYCGYLGMDCNRFSIFCCNCGSFESFFALMRFSKASFFLFSSNCTTARW